VNQLPSARRGWPVDRIVKRLLAGGWVGFALWLVYLSLAWAVWLPIVWRFGPPSGDDTDA
jgi:hypothetical protein